MKKQQFYFAFVSIIFYLMTSLSDASCGLAGCPVGHSSSGSVQHVFDQALRYVSFDLDHHDGNYIQYEPRYEYRGLSRAIFGGFASYISLDNGHESHSGLGNPVLFGQYNFSNSSQYDFYLGSQLELALGDDDHGLAAEHTEIVPYLNFAHSMKRLHWMGALGYRYALDSNDGHGPAHHSPLFVNPHSDKEFLYRIHAQFSSTNHKMTPEIFFDGQHAMDGEDDGIGFLTAGVGLGLQTTEGFVLTPKVEFPLSSPKRFDSRLSLHAALFF